MIPHRQLDAIYKPHYVYRIYGDGGRLLYVGCTARPDKRPYQHGHLLPSRVTVSDAMSCYDGYVEEARAIREERPLRNVRKGVCFPPKIRSQADLEVAASRFRRLRDAVPLVPRMEVLT